MLLSCLTSFAVDFIAGDRKYRVDGRFPLRDPWWLISCTVRQGQRKVFLKGFPSYSLRTDLTPEDGRSIVSLFLTACGANPDFVTMFMEWLPKDRHVEPGNVINTLEDFETSKPEHKAIAEQLKSSVSRSSESNFTTFSSLPLQKMNHVFTTNKTTKTTVTVVKGAVCRF